MDHRVWAFLSIAISFEILQVCFLDRSDLLTRAGRTGTRGFHCNGASVEAAGRLCEFAMSALTWVSGVPVVLSARS